MITCMDGRVDPAQILGVQLGDALVLRNAGGRVTEDAFDIASDVSQSAIDALRAAIERNDVILRVPGRRFVAVDQRDELLATADGDGVAIWDIASETVVDQYQRDDGARAVAAAFSPDGTQLAVAYGGADEMIRLWDLETREFSDFGGATKSTDEGFVLSFSPDRTHIAFNSPSDGDEPSAIQYWSMEPLELLIKEAGFVGFPSFMSDGRLAYGTCEPVGDLDSCIVRILDPISGATTDSPRLGIDTLFVSESPDGRFVLTGNQEAISVVDLETWDIVATTTVDRVAFPRWTRSGERFVASGEAGVRLFDASTAEVVRNLRGVSGGVWVTQPLSSHDRLGAASIIGKETVIFDVSALGSSEVDAWTVPMSGIWTANYADATEGIVLANGGAFAEGGQSVGLFDAAGLPLDVLAGGRSDWFPWASHNGCLITFLGTDGRWSALNTTSAEVEYTAPDDFRLHGINDNGTQAIIVNDAGETHLVRIPGDSTRLDMGDAVQVVFDASLKYFAVWDNVGQTNIVFDADTGERLVTLGLEYGGLAPEFTWDSSKLLIAGFGELFVFDLGALLDGATEEEALVRRIQTGDNLILRVAVSPDDSMVLTTAWSEPLRVWDLETGAPLGEFGGELEGATLHNGDFHPTLPHLMVTSPPNEVRIHTLDLEELTAIARDRLTRGFTPEECVLYEIRDCDDA